MPDKQERLQRENGQLKKYFRILMSMNWKNLMSSYLKYTDDNNSTLRIALKKSF